MDVYGQAVYLPRTIGCNAGDLKQLEAAGYVISFNSGVLVVTDWKVNNFLRKDRHANTVHQSELAQLTELSTGRYILGGSGQPNNNQRSTGGQPHGNQSSTQYSIEKDSVVKGRLDKESKALTDTMRRNTHERMTIRHRLKGWCFFTSDAVIIIRKFRKTIYI